MTEQLHTLTVYGASDDLVEVEGYIEDEFEAYGPTTLIVTAPDGARIAITAEFDGPGPMRDVGDGWVLSIHHADPEWTYPVRLGVRRDRDSDPAIVLSVPTGTTVREWDDAE